MNTWAVWVVTKAVVGRGSWLSLVGLFGAAWSLDRAQRASRPAMMRRTMGIASHTCSELGPFSATKVRQIIRTFTPCAGGQEQMSLDSPAPRRSPAETGRRAAFAPRRFAPAVRVGLPSNRIPQRGLQQPWANPERVHADVVAAPEVVHGSAALVARRGVLMARADGGASMIVDDPQGIGSPLTRVAALASDAPKSATAKPNWTRR